MTNGLIDALTAPTPQPVALDYDLYEQFSARLHVSCGDQEFTIPDFGSMTDGLGDLVRAALSVAAGAQYAEVLFDTEPQRWGLAIEPAGLSDEKVRIKRLTIKDGGSSLTSDGLSGRPVWMWSTSPLLEGYVAADDFARAVQLTALKMREQFDDQTYREMWGHHGSLEGFPLRGLLALEVALATPEYRE